MSVKIKVTIIVTKQYFLGERRSKGFGLVNLPRIEK
jgi:hypothetical protein